MKRAIICAIIAVLLVTVSIAGARFVFDDWTIVAPEREFGGTLGDDGFSWMEFWLSNRITWEGIVEDEFEWRLWLGGEPVSDETFILVHNGLTNVVTNAMLDNADNFVMNSLTIQDTLDMTNSPITDVKYIDFNLFDGTAQAEGRMVWNDDDGVLNVGLKGGIVNLQVGLEMLVRGKNTTGLSIGNGVAVRILGGSGSFPTFAFSNAADLPNSLSIGIATEVIADNQFGYVTTFGLVRELDTSSWSAGDILWLADSLGGLTNTVPTDSSRKLMIGHVVRESANEGIVMVHTNSHPYFNELSGPALTEGSVPFVSAFGNLVEDNSNLYFDDTTDNLGVGVGVPDSAFVNAVEAQVFVLNSPRWDDMRMPGTLGRPGSATPTFRAGAISNAIGVYCFSPTVDNELYFISQTPHSYKEGTDVELHLHWLPRTSSAGNVAWVVETEWENIGSTLATTTFWNAVPDAADGVADKHQLHEMIDLDGTGKLISSMFFIHIYRDANESQTPPGSDSYADGACLLEVDIHYQSDTPGGSAEEDSK